MGRLEMLWRTEATALPREGVGALSAGVWGLRRAPRRSVGAGLVPEEPRCIDPNV